MKYSPTTTNQFSIPTGSGCIAALEAEKFLAEQEDYQPNSSTSGAPVENGIDIGAGAKKADDGTDAAPEYRPNPLL